MTTLVHPLVKGAPVTGLVHARWRMFFGSADVTIPTRIVQINDPITFLDARGIMHHAIVLAPPSIFYRHEFFQVRFLLPDGTPTVTNIAAIQDYPQNWLPGHRAPNDEELHALIATRALLR